jgi:two-component system, cell cycle sensor histidine kinase and response regulator CckA
VSEHPTEGDRGALLEWLAAGTVHDVNNLLVLVVGCAEMALDDQSLNPRARQLVQEIAGAGERASLLTRQFLALGTPAVRPVAPIDVSAVLRSSESLLRRVAGDHIRVRIDPGTSPQWVLAASSQIDQILVNLATNARDAMPSGGTLHISASEVGSDLATDERATTAPPVTRIVVADTGGGIDPAVQDRLFDAFVTTKAEGRGSGLGLAVVRAIVDQLGGDIQVQSAPGQGTTFTLDFPQASPPGDRVSE